MRHWIESLGDINPMSSDAAHLKNLYSDLLKRINHILEEEKYRNIYAQQYWSHQDIEQAQKQCDYSPVKEHLAIILNHSLKLDNH